jgi:DNA-binding NarL/FixJ family response regulator
MKRTPNRVAPRARRQIFIVDDHPITRYGLIQLINREPDLHVCGERGDAQTALAAIKPEQPDLVLADITMPGKSGLEFLKDLHAIAPSLPVLVMSMHDEGLFAERILRAGGRGYIMKSEGGEKLLEAVRQVLNGKVYVSRRISELILESLTRSPRTEDSRPRALSDREFEVFQLLGQGLSTYEIGERLHLSPKTVGTHRLHIKEKLKLRTRAELIKQAVRWAATQQLV